MMTMVPRSGCDSHTARLMANRADHVFFHSKKRMKELLKQNKFHEVMRRRYLRTRLRALDGKQVNFYHKMEIQKTKQRRVGNKTRRYKVCCATLLGRAAHNRAGA